LERKRVGFWAGEEHVIGHDKNRLLDSRRTCFEQVVRRLSGRRRLRCWTKVVEHNKSRLLDRRAGHWT
jgi:hypothetical protein